MKNILTPLLLCLFCIGCISDVDFDQIDEVQIETTHLISLVYFKADVDNFLDDLGNETLFISDTTDLPIFGWPYNENYLVQADFQFKSSNTFDRNMTFQVEFLDENNNSLLEFQPQVVQSDFLDFDETEIIGEDDIQIILPTQKFVIKLLLNPGPTLLDPDQNMEFNFQSAVTFHYQVTADEE